MFRLRSLAFFALVFFCLSLNTQAASQPDAGQILQQQKTPAKLPQQFPESEAEPAQSDQSVTELKILISGFQFQGFAGLATEAELQEIVSPALGKTLGLTELNALVKEVTTYLQGKGYLLVRAYLPKQDVTQGVIQIAIISGTVQGAPDIRLSEPSRIKKQVLIEIANSGAPAGEALQRNRFERSLLLMNDLSGISARSILEKGDQPGSTRIFIEAQEGPPVTGVLSVDNFGNRYTGLMQLAAQLAINNLSGYADQLVVAATAATGLKKGQLSYSSPLGITGLKGNLSFTGLKYKLGKDFESLDAKGTAQTLNGNISYPIIRSRVFSFWYEGEYEYRSLDDEVGGVTTRERTINVVSNKLSLSYYDKFGGGGMTNVYATASIGSLDLGLAADAAIDAITAQTSGGYNKISYSLSRLQRLTQNYTLFGSFSGQFASQNLDSSEKFSLGGASAVRSYPVGEASADEGFSLSTEVRYDVQRKLGGSNLQIVGFFDTGRIKLHDSPWANSINSATGKNIYWLSGLGLGVNLDNPGKYAVRTSYVHTLGNNPGRSNDDKNTDGKDNNHQIWLQAIVWF